MLLNQVISTQQALYFTIQNEIDDLLENQRQIQIYLQSLGTVESQMVSAASLLREAIAAIQNICPDELDNYKTTVASLFDGVIRLLPSPETEDEEDTETETEDEEDTETEDEDEEDTETEDEDEEDTETETEDEDEEDTETEDDTRTESIDLFNKIIIHSRHLPWTAYKKYICSHLKVDVRATRREMDNIFVDYVVSQDLETLREMIAKIEA